MKRLSRVGLSLKYSYSCKGCGRVCYPSFPLLARANMRLCRDCFEKLKSEGDKNA